MKKSRVANRKGNKVNKGKNRNILVVSAAIVILLAIAAAFVLAFDVFDIFKDQVKIVDDKVDDKVEDNIVRVSDLAVNKLTVEILEGASFQLEVAVKPDNATNKVVSFMIDNNNIAVVENNGKITGKKAGSCQVSVMSFDGKGIVKIVKVTVKAKAKPPVVVDNKGGLTYIQGILVVNKTYALPTTYNPGLNKNAMAAFDNMKKAAAKDGNNLFVVSGFRSYSYQVTLYQRYVARSVQAEADRYSARPGHSEHQTGLALDLNSADSSFAGTKEAVWLAKNSYKYGFIVRYPKGKESITGYMYEPWHMRYLGIDNATKVFNSGLCLEEYLKIDSKYR